MSLFQQLGFAAALPEIALAILAMVLLLEGVMIKSTTPSTIRGGAIAGLAAVAALVIWKSGTGSVSAFNGAFVTDTFARVMKVMALFGAAVTLAMSGKYLRRNNMDSNEYPVLILLATVGMMLMISASDLIGLYLGVELQSLALYVVAAMNRDSAQASEAGLKYFVLGALSSGLLLYGASLIYGFTGHTDFATIATAVQTSSPSVGVVFGLVFLMASLAFKISAVP
ncbi:MAG: proton-conducting transporter membrane subunit, partial [Aestuariivirga sp.]